MSDALATLLFPFERGLLDTPPRGERVIILGGAAGLQLPDDFSDDVQVQQDFRPDYLALEKAGFHTIPQIEEKGFDAALVFLGRHRRENERRLAQALVSVRPGGLIIAAGTKKNGASSMAKRIAALLPLESQVSKHHGVAFWLRRPEQLDPAVADALFGDASFTANGYETPPGGFSEGQIDPGSQLLAETLPDDVSGHVADFAAGWGYLSLSLAERAAPTTIDLYEAHRPSLNAARRNLDAHAPDVACRFFWCDLLSEHVENRYDAIVMNPPFHRGRASEPDIGRKMVASAAKALNPGGRLFLVANRTLPYEAVLETEFSRQAEIGSDSAYKVFWATR